MIPVPRPSRRPLLGALLLLALGVSSSLFAGSTPLQSPQGRWKISIETGSRLALSVTDGGNQPLLTQEIGLTFEGGQQLISGEPVSIKTRSARETVRPTLPVKQALLDDHFEEATLQFPGGLSLIVRAYDQGFAYRFASAQDGVVKVKNETSVTHFPGEPVLYNGPEKGFYSHTELSYGAQPLAKVAPKTLTSLPVLVRGSVAGASFVFSETALEDYPGQWMEAGSDGKSLVSVWPAYPTKVEETTDRDIVVHERANYLAEVSGRRAFPWRFVALAANDGELLTNTLSYLLADPSRVTDTSWIKVGKVQWDWWHDNNVWDVDFRGGVTQALYKHYIDFAAQHKMTYIILDEGWYKLGDLTTQVGDIDVPALVNYGKTKGVGVILWATWSTLLKQFDQVMPLFEKWGVAGLKVDFFQRDDQPAVQFYWKLAADTAKRKMLLDVHGAHKPAGLQRTYPNVITFEGVKGLENNKWSEWVTPEHDTTLPFVRQVAGPMDYTPGATDNAQKDQFKAIFRRPMSQGTRAHQLALYLVFESPLQMLADSPSAYRREPDMMAFLDQVPTLWDETRVLDARIAQHVAVARRHGERWFVGGLNNSEARSLTVDLSFLPASVTQLEVWQDGPNADRDGRDCVRRVMDLPANKKVTLDMAPGGGWVAIAR